MQIQTIATTNSKHSNAMSNPSNEIQSIRMHILTIVKNSNDANSNYANEIQNTRMQLLTFWKEFDAFKFQIRTIQIKLEAFECKF